MSDTQAYLAALPDALRTALEKLLKQILAAAPGAEEYFGYGMPTLKYNGHPMSIPAPRRTISRCMAPYRPASRSN
jgi:uncharacterized protein YdhG (YjbR/CyaY superfamily)